MNCLIYDYETLDTDRSACVVALAITQFNLKDCVEGVYTEEILRDNIDVFLFDIEEQQQMGRTVTPSTIDWWQTKVDPSVFKRLFSPHGRISIGEIPEIFRSRGSEDTSMVFSRGNTFDPLITMHICNQLKVPPVYPFWCDRDTRSFLDAYLWDTELDNGFIPKGLGNLNKHDPEVDLILDIMRIQTVFSSVS